MTTAEKLSLGLTAIGTFATVAWVYSSYQAQQAAAAKAASPTGPTTAAQQQATQRLLAADATGLNV